MILNYSTSSLTLIILLLSLIGLGFSYIAYIYKFHSLIFFTIFLEKKSTFLNKVLALKLKLYYTFSSKWFFDKFYNVLVVFTIKVMYKLFLILDKGFFEFLGPYGIALYSSSISSNFIYGNKGFLLQYLTLIYYGIFFMFFSFFLLILF